MTGSKQVDAKQKEDETGESELRLAQLQHQLPSNEPGALMHLVEDVAGEDEEDQDTKECKKHFENMKFFLGREVRPTSFDSVDATSQEFVFYANQELGFVLVTGLSLFSVFF